MISAYIQSIEVLPEVLDEAEIIQKELVNSENNWRVCQLIKDWKLQHIKQFFNVAKRAIEIKALKDKDKDENINRIHEIAQKLKEKGIDLIPILNDICNEYVLFNVGIALVKGIKDGLISEIKKGVKQKDVDTQSLASNVPEEISQNPKYLKFLAQTMNGLKQMK